METGEIIRKKGRDIVLIQEDNMRIEKFQCCNQEITHGDIWFLKDIKDFTARKLYKGICNVCGDDTVLLIQTRIKDNKVYGNNLTGIEAVKTIYREKKRRLQVIYDIGSSSLYGWIYGVNREFRNKNGEVTRVKQYSYDFGGNKKLTKLIKVK